jgi:two-component system OmpR family response regulator
MKKRILVVDDDASIRQLVKTYLEPEGWDVEEAGTGNECVSRALASPPDAIFLDVNLPDADGRDVCRKLKADPLLEKTAVIIISGCKTAVADKVEGLDHGAVDYISKPFQMKILTARLEALLRTVEQ